jgi:hypothetical protein
MYFNLSCLSSIYVTSTLYPWKFSWRLLLNLGFPWAASTFSPLQGFWTTWFLSILSPQTTNRADWIISIQVCMVVVENALGYHWESTVGAHFKFGYIGSSNHIVLCFPQSNQCPCLRQRTGRFHSMCGIAVSNMLSLRHFNTIYRLMIILEYSLVFLQGKMTHRLSRLGIWGPLCNGQITSGCLCQSHQY